MIYVLTFAVSLPLVVGLLLRNPKVQTVVSKSAAAYLTRQMNMEVKIGELNINYNGTLLITDFEIFDDHQDKMLEVQNLELLIGSINKEQKRVTVRSFKLTGVEFALRKYSGDEAANLGFFLQHFQSRKPSDTINTSSKPIPWLLVCNKLELRNMHFIHENQERKRDRSGIDFNDIELRDMDILMSNLKVAGDTISARINSLAFIEKSGFELMDFSGNAWFSPVGLKVDNLLAHTNNSTLDLDLVFSYDGLGAFKDFLEKVRYHGVFRETELEMSDIGYFAPVMFSMTDLIKLSGDFSGYVTNFRGRDFKLSFGDHTSFSGSVRMSGLPDITNTYIHADLKNFETSASDIENFALPADADPIQLPGLLHKMGVINVDGKFTGFYNDFVSNALFDSKLGALKTDITLKALKGEKELAYSGILQGRELDIGKLFGLESKLGKTNFAVEVDGDGIDLDNLEIGMKGSVRSLDFNHYNYQNIRVDGQLIHKVFNGKFDIKDENLDINFLGLIDFNGQIPTFDFNSLIRHADLFALKITDSDSVSIFSTDINIDFAGTDIDKLEGSVVFSNTSYLNSNQWFAMDSLAVHIFEDAASINSIVLASDFVDAGLTGKFRLSQMGASVNHFIRNYSEVLAGSFSAGKGLFDEQDITFDINLKAPGLPLKLFVPRLEVAPETRLDGTFTTLTNEFVLNAESSWLNLSNIMVRDWSIAVSSNDEIFQLSTFGEKVYFSEPNETDTLGIGFDSLMLKAGFRADTINYKILWNDLSNKQANTGDFEGLLAFESLQSQKMKFTDVQMKVDSSVWNVNHNNLVVADTAGIFFQDLWFYNDSSLFSINGGISHNPADSLKLLFENLNISHLDQLIINQAIDLNGVLNGEASFVNLYENPNFLIDVELKDIYFNGQDFGLLQLNTTWNESRDFLDVNLDVMRRGNIGISEILKLDGRYFPTSKTQNFDFNIELNNLNTHIFNPFVDEYVDIADESLASGKLEVSGSYDKPVLEGKIDIMRTQVLVKYLNVYYSVGGSIDIGENFININQLLLYDARSSSATCSGNIHHNYFRDFNLDILINQEDFRALNTTSRENEFFYGTAIVSGNVSITGPFDDINMDISAKTENGTRIMIPISSAVNVSENDFIIFINTSDTLEKEKEKYVVDLKGLTLNLDLDVTNAADIEIFLPYSMGDITGNGNGKIRLGVNPRGDFTINGDYVIEEGKFFFSLENLIGREFDIKSGSKISWAGNPYDANADITAVYPVKTTLTGLRLQTDSTSVYNTRVNVECIVNLRNDLFNPDINFSIDFENVAEDIKQIIFASLDTTDQSAMSQQMVSLMVLGSFSYAASRPNIGTTGFKLLSNQLSDWLSKISKDIDIGVNYQPGTSLTEDELEVALRTQLFNDRLSIDGNFGVRGTNKKSENASDVLGDINIEYKITEDGHFRVRAFNRTNDISFLEDNAPYTQGVGVFYRKEFEKFGDLFKWNKRDKKEKKAKKSGTTNPNKSAIREDE